MANPRFDQYLVASDPPLESEVSVAREMSVSDARKEIAGLKAQIATLSLRQKNLEGYVAHHERIVFSINRLPPEILSLVFSFCLRSQKRIERLASTNVKSDSPWLVGHVCALWRKISVSSQSFKLWARPIITPSLNQSLSQLNVQLSRSGNAKLHPCIRGDSPQRLPHPELLVSMCKTSNRWASFLFSFDWTLAALQPPLAPVKGNVGQLDELAIEGVWGDGSSVLAEGDRLDAFAIAPRLRMLSFVDICEPASTLILPWHQLTHLRALTSGHEHLAVLNLCPNLVYAHLDTPVSVRLKQLRKLHLVNGEFLRIMSLPVLEEIVLERMVTESDALLSLLSLLRRDHPPLSSISLFHGALVTPTLSTVLEENPNVTTLSIYIQKTDTDAVNEFISRLEIAPIHTACFAPNLATLELGGRGGFDQERFLNMTTFISPLLISTR
ncbi:hypothetical protein B0H11DRAFT_2075830 [Mycena galericulata]|nr:hypothetical protein B0H11DRAFT_2075830 [Mycena galericulata]